MPTKRKPNPSSRKIWRERKQYKSVSRRVGTWQLIFVLFLVLIIPLFVFVIVQTSRSQQVLGSQTYEAGAK